MDSSKRIIHADAKIVGRDKAVGEKRVFVGYKEIDGDVSLVKEVEGAELDQTYGAELYAVNLAVEFALKEIGKDAGLQFLILCDHESVVDLIRRPVLKPRFRTRPVLMQIRQRLEENHSITVDHFPLNQADRLLDLHWNRLKNGST